MSRPRLHPDIIDGDSAVLGAVDRLFERNAAYGNHARKIVAAQQRPQELASEHASIAYLDVEQLVNERVNLMLAITARWAFNEGRRTCRGGR